MPPTSITTLPRSRARESSRRASRAPTRYVPDTSISPRKHRAALPPPCPTILVVVARPIPSAATQPRPARPQPGKALRNQPLPTTNLLPPARQPPQEQVTLRRCLEPPKCSRAPNHWATTGPTQAIPRAADAGPVLRARIPLRHHVAAKSLRRWPLLPSLIVSNICSILCKPAPTRLREGPRRSWRSQPLAGSR